MAGRPVGGGKKRFFYKKKKFCRFCSEGIEVIDYKNTNFLKSFLHEGSMIAPRRTTGTCAKHQRKLTTAIKRARAMALLPYVAE